MPRDIFNNEKFTPGPGFYDRPYHSNFNAIHKVPLNKHSNPSDPFPVR